VRLLHEPNPFPYALSNKRYHTWDYFLKSRFGGKVAKIPLDAGFSCPNIDGTTGIGGCSYCLYAASSVPEPLELQFVRGQQIMRRKWPQIIGWIPYFQANTNTYAPLNALQALFEPMLKQEDVVGLAIATRADALPEEICDYLADLSRRTYLLVELGLQTVHDETAARIGRGHSFQTFLEGFHRLRARKIPICVHIIDGLPGETPQMMRETADQLAELQPESLKIHLLHILSGTRMAQDYLSGEFPALTQQEYISIVCDQLELLPPEMVMQRLTGDGMRDRLIAPLWSLKKTTVLNEIDKELVRRNSWQGKYYHG
jgi:radical SAM protein (TIGR01212 family)